MKKKEWHDHIKAVGQYRSAFEAEIARQLTEAGIEFEHEATRLPYQFSDGPHVYIPDFTIQTWYGTKIYIEAKGWVDPRAKVKMNAVKTAHPYLDLRFVFQSERTKGIHPVNDAGSFALMAG